MGREIRKVPSGWVHPKNSDGRHIALSDGIKLAGHVDNWNKEAAAWNRGEFPSWATGDCQKMTYSEYNGEKPRAEDYMPQFPDCERTHMMMYETCTEGTPVSPAFFDGEELARWLVKNEVSIFGYQTADFDTWMKIIGGQDAYLMSSPDSGLGVKIL